MPRSELTERIGRAAGTPAGGPDTSALWQRGRRRRRTKRLSSVAGVAAIVTAAVVAVPALDGVPRPVEIGPADTPRVEQLPQVPLPNPATGPASLPTLEHTTDAQLVLTRDGVAHFVDVDRQHIETRRLSELAAGDPPERLIVGDQLVLYGGATTYVMDPHPDAEVEPLTDQPPFSVFVDAGVPDRVWIRGGRTDNAPAEILQIGLDGTVELGPTLSPSGNLAVGLRNTVVLQRYDGLVVWDPAEDEILLTVDGPFPMGTDGHRFAWCDQPCQRLYLTDPTTGTTDLLAELPDDASFAGYDGRISPDGRYLATPICLDGDPRRCALTVLDLDHQRAWTVADGHHEGYGKPAWSPDSRWVFIHLTDDRLAAYQPGRTEAEQLNIDPLPRPYGFGATPAPTNP